VCLPPGRQHGSDRRRGAEGPGRQHLPLHRLPGSGGGSEVSSQGEVTMTATTPIVSGKLIGARVQRVEDERFLRGEGRYVADLTLPGMVHAAFVRSPYGHARIQ